MNDYSLQEAAERAGVALEDLGRLVELGVLTPAPGVRFTAGDIRRAVLIQSIQAAGLPLDGLVAALHSGELTLDFMDMPVYERFAGLTEVTFRELSERTGIPMELLIAMREATGSAQPSPDDLVNDAEMEIVPFLELQVRAGFLPNGLERLMRVQGDSLRRIAEAEAEWFRSEVLMPRLAAGQGVAEIGSIEGIGEEAPALQERAFLAMWHAQEKHTWTGNIIELIEMLLARAGLYQPIERPPAMCFLDITGYTRLTQERGDESAAELAAQLNRLVHRVSVQKGGRPVKWLGDGVMFYFPQPGPGVLAALDMADGVADAGLPPAHVGLHAGPVVFQEGDYFGQTVNLASRIAEYARPGEVLVSQAVVEASQGVDVAFTDIGPVELKGVASPIHLLQAHRASS
jgi:adenylate cyclase